MRALVVLTCAMVGVVAGFAEPQTTGASRVTENTALPKTVGPIPLLTEDQVRGWVKSWQRRLALEDWQVEVKIVRIWELPQGAIANIHWSLPNKKAIIKVLHTIDSNVARSGVIKDTELSVVHELVHLSMAKLPLDPNHTELEEETVKKISMALLDLEKR
ncbi:MAG TPA: hypothetical protein VMZ52_19100 [Bryobacteraceae bacterium]|nr:hypothetical protein [Bryobacteraceae bacterium]